jgi:hypothetical protein
MNGVEDQNKEENTVESDEISSPKGFNGVASDTRDIILSPENAVTDLVTPQSGWVEGTVERWSPV